MRSKGKVTVGMLVIAVTILVLLCLCISPIIAYSTDEVVTVKVTGTEVKRYDDSDKYIVFTESGTFKNEDSFWYWKWNSSDIQGKLKSMEGQTIKLRIYGWRIPFLSMYENVISIEQ